MRKIFLALSCLALLAPMFLVAITSSALYPYDPWSDLDADGDIDIFDVVKMAGSYDTTGDPTKDVNVINWPTNLLAFTFQLTLSAGGSYATPWISTYRYSKVTVCLYSTGSANVYHLEARHAPDGISFYVDVKSNVYLDYVKTYDVPNEQIHVYFKNNAASTMTLYVDVYFTV